jgi:hypothetical protein
VARAGSGADLSILPALANRHGLITGATAGKTVTLQVLGWFSRIGVPVFTADVMISPASRPRARTHRAAQRLQLLGVEEPAWRASRRVLDVFGESAPGARRSPTWGRSCSADCSV